MGRYRLPRRNSLAPRQFAIDQACRCPRVVDRPADKVVGMFRGNVFSQDVDERNVSRVVDPGTLVVSAPPVTVSPTRVALRSPPKRGQPWASMVIPPMAEASTRIAVDLNFPSPRASRLASDSSKRSWFDPTRKGSPAEREVPVVNNRVVERGDDETFDTRPGTYSPRLP